jgi:hypothetical protein
MGKEDQQEEREVLASIFPDEITGTKNIATTHVNGSLFLPKHPTTPNIALEH